jgi:hypothetical protein
MSRLSAVPALCVLVALTVAACGRSDAAKIADAIEDAGASRDPDDCTKLRMETYNEQVELERGEAATESCEEAVRAGSAAADSVLVSRIEINDDLETAEADAEIDGGLFDGQTIRIDVVKEDGRWRLEDVESFEIFRREVFLEALETVSRAPPDSLTAEQAQCFVSELDRLSDRQLQDAFIENDLETFDRALQACA